MVTGAACMLFIRRSKRAKTANWYCFVTVVSPLAELFSAGLMDIDMMHAGMDVQAVWDLMDIVDPEMLGDELLERELALLQDAAAAEVAVPVPSAHLMPGNAPAVAVAAADAAAGAAIFQQQNLPVNNEEAAAAVQQRLAEFEESITVARVAVQTARRLYRKLLGSMFTPVEKDAIIQCINSIEMYIDTYADYMRGRQFDFGPSRAGAVLDEVANALEHFQQKLQHTVASNAMDLHASVRLRCVMSYLQHIYAAFQPEELPARQQRLQHACDHQDAIRQAAPPIHDEHLTVHLQLREPRWLKRVTDQHGDEILVLYIRDNQLDDADVLNHNLRVTSEANAGFLPHVWAATPPQLAVQSSYVVLSADTPENENLNQLKLSLSKPANDVNQQLIAAGHRQLGMTPVPPQHGQPTGYSTLCSGLPASSKNRRHWSIQLQLGDEQHAVYTYNSGAMRFKTHKRACWYGLTDHYGDFEVRMTRVPPAA
eukprot:13989-Heterococcus_DN1.PRE.2